MATPARPKSAAIDTARCVMLGWWPMRATMATMRATNDTSSGRSSQPKRRTSLRYSRRDEMNEPTLRVSASSSRPLSHSAPGLSSADIARTTWWPSGVSPGLRGSSKALSASKR